MIAARQLRFARWWVPLLALGACVARGENPLTRQTDDDAGGPPILDGGGGKDSSFDLPDAAPHAVLGVDPPHGPWIGGDLVTIRGNGFSSAARVWIGGLEVPASDVLAIDPTRLQVTVPPGNPGAQTVEVQNADDASTHGALLGGYSYDLFYAEPDTGPTSGGTRVTLRGKGTNWSDGTQVLVDLKPCTNVVVKATDALECSVPATTQGTKPIRVTTPDTVSVDVLDAFVYGDTSNGFRGGLSGNTLGSELRVIVLDDYSGNAIPNAKVILGDDVANAGTTNSQGVVVFSQASLGPKRSVTIASKCYQPITFADVPVDTVTAYLSPVLSVDCIDDGDPPATGGQGSYGVNVQGELVWSGGREFEKATWTNVPNPKGADERQAAYLFRFTSDATREFTLPGEGSRVQPDSPGKQGYEFSSSTSAGNLSFYALAGIENRKLTPPVFTAYAMGIVKGINAEPGQTVKDVYIPMDIPLDHALTVQIQGPTPTNKGPDRVRTSIAIRVGNEGYALLPVGTRTSLLPLSGDLSFVGMPALGGALLGSSYVSGARAFTGAADTTPRSVLALRGQTSSALPISLTGFVEVPRLEAPQQNQSWDGTSLSWDWPIGGSNVDLVVIEILGNGGLVQWTIAVPGSQKSVQLPDLRTLSDLGIKPGPITIGVSLASIQDFDYGSLVYRQLGTRGWNAYATDVFQLHLAAP
ncbi:MAG: IPT/TIG domain-containing protein [Polyangiaceae bacterium]